MAKLTKRYTILLFTTLCLLCLIDDALAGKTDRGRNQNEVEDEGREFRARGSKRQASTLNVYVIPHSHMDVGWVYTVQESMHAYAANVYTTVIAELVKSPARRFIAVEQEFFRLWWDGVATEKEKNQTRSLVSNGQLEFIIGGQVMHDEAVTELSAIIQQMTEGHAFIYETFGVRPQFGWHVDPFGASAATPTLFALMGFNAHLTSRIDYDVKAEMMRNKGLQFVWQASPSLGADQRMFTHVMDSYSYCVPMDHPPFSNRSGYMWNGIALFPDPPPDGIYPDQSDPVTKQNLAQYADFMVANIKQRAAWFKSPHLLWPWGCDKQFFNANDQFQNMDKLLTYINQQRSRYNIKIRYATVGEFFGALHGSTTSWDVKTAGDFLPYSTAREEAWTGFYTSRIELKGLARASQATLRAGETLFTLYTHLYNVSRTLNTTEELERLKTLRWATAEVQHHDGVTGTEAPPVRDMYIEHLQSGGAATVAVMTDILTELGINKDTGGDGAEYDVIETRSAEGSTRKAVTISVYNSLGWAVRRLVRMPVDSPNITVLNSTGQAVPSQTSMAEDLGQPYRLYFFASLPPIGYRTFVLLYFDDDFHNGSAHASQPALVRSYETSGPQRSAEDAETMHGDGRIEGVSIENQCYKVTFDAATYLLSSITDKRTGNVTHVGAKFLEYHVYHNVLFGQPSNNYIFRPYGPAVGINSFRVQMNFTNGTLVEEVTQQFYGLFDTESRYSVTTRLLKDTGPGSADEVTCGHIELDFRVGPLSINKELVYRISTPLQTIGNLYADVNAFQTMNRTRRRTATIAQNMFPMVSAAYVEDAAADWRLMLLSDRSHGVSSQRDGDLEVMLHRRLVNNEFQDHDYNLTLGEPSIATSRFWLLLGNSSTTSGLRHRSWLQLENPPVVVQVGPELSSMDGVNWGAFRTQSKSPSSGIADVLPPNIHLLTFKTPGWNYNDSASKKDRVKDTASSPNLARVLLRLQHLYEAGEHPVLSQSVTLDLQKILAPLGTIQVANERSLTGIWDVKKINRWVWKTKGTDPVTQPSEEPARPNDTSSAAASFQVTLKPQEIKTFFVTMQAPTS